SVPQAKFGLVNVWLFSTPDPESSTWIATRVRRQSLSYSLTHKDRDALRESLGGLGVETSPEFEGICAQSFASLTDQLLQLCEFIAESFIAAFLLQTRPKKS